MSFPNAGCLLATIFLALVLASGCSGSSADADNPNATTIRAIEASIKEWKRMEESGDWQEMIKDGVAIDAIGDNSFNSKLEEYPKFKIVELEERLEKLKNEATE